VDVTNPIHSRVGVPMVKKGSVLYAVPAELILQLIQVVPITRQEKEYVESPDQAYWINWWITYGECKYPEKHRWRLQRLYRWRKEYFT
jgi:hypothetical protein